jgi:ABC-2 type transport system ATP-binding protein
MFAVEVNNLRKEFFRRDATRTGLRKRRRRVAALEGVTFTIERGECVAILGQNGSGKSTLVRLLSTLLLPDGGSARIFGHDVVKEPRAVQRLVNRVSVEASFFKKMSSEDVRVDTNPTASSIAVPSRGRFGVQGRTEA